MSSSPFANLPPIYFNQVDVAALQQAVIVGFQNMWFADTGETLVLTAADRRYHFLLSLCAYLVNEHQLIDLSAKQNLLPYAEGGFLDNLAAIYGPRAIRLEPAPAVTTLQFTLAMSLGNDSLIPAGTQVASSSRPNITFSTDEDLVIQSGSLAGTVDASCTTPGTGGNGLLPGDLVQIVNWTGNFVVAVTNIDITAGGGDVEDHDDYRERIYDVTDSYSNAGSYGAYKFFAESADPSISMVSVSGPEDGLQPGNVLVTVLLEGGVIPNQAMLDKVYAAVNPDTIRDLCAMVTVAGPSQIPYSITVNYWIDTSALNNLANIQAQVAAAVDTFVTNAKSYLAGSINPALLSKMVLDAGASYCDVIEPVHTILTKSQVGILVNDPLLVYMGTETDYAPS